MSARLVKKFKAIAGSPFQPIGLQLAEIPAAEVLRIVQLPKPARLEEFDRMAAIVREQVANGHKALDQVLSGLSDLRKVVEAEPEN